MNHLKPIYSKLKKSILALAYPALCLHCENLKADPEFLLCDLCTEQLVMVSPSERCAFCFGIKDSVEIDICNICRHRPSLFHGVASVFDYEGPAATMVRKLKYSDQAYLAKGCGAYLAAQYLALEWPFPDFIIPVPISLMRRLERGYNQSTLMAQSMGDLMGCRVEDCLVRASGHYSQAGLSYEQRLKLGQNEIRLGSREDFYDKTIVIIDDVLTTGSTIKRSAEALLEGFPARIYALTLCRTIN